jgi:chromosome segregation ATPase
MAQLEGSDRYDGVVEYLRNSVNKLLSGPPFASGKKHRIDPATVSSRLVEVLKNVLSSEREKDLEALVDKLDGMIAERSRLQGERNQIRETTHKEAERYMQENTRLQQEHARLEEEVKRIEQDHESKRQIYREQLAHKKSELKQFRAIAEIAHATQRSLAEEVETLRQTALKMHRNQVRYCRKARDLCVEQLNVTV